MVKLSLSFREKRMKCAFLGIFLLLPIVFIMTSCTEQNVKTNEMFASTLIIDREDTRDDVEPIKPPIINNRYLTLRHLNLNNQGNEIMVKPLKLIKASVDFVYHCPDCEPNSSNQIIVGLARRSAQACIYQGGPSGSGSANFMLKMPAKPGKYEVRFRGLQAENCVDALKAGWNAQDSPSKDTTIGRIIVSKKAMD